MILGKASPFYSGVAGRHKIPCVGWHPAEWEVIIINNEPALMMPPLG
jgi:hypothetical protein